MNQLTAEVWNKGAQLAAPATAWGRRVLRLNQEEMDRATEAFEANLLPVLPVGVVLGLEKVLPPLWEPGVCAALREMDLDLAGVVPELDGPEAAVELATLEHRLDEGEQRLMREWLEEKKDELARAWTVPSQPGR